MPWSTALVPQARLFSRDLAQLPLASEALAAAMLRGTTFNLLPKTRRYQKHSRYHRDTGTDTYARIPTYSRVHTCMRVIHAYQRPQRWCWDASAHKHTRTPHTHTYTYTYIHAHTQFCAINPLTSYSSLG